MNIITRSGSNDFHGDVFGYLRNRNFQAVNPFSTVSNPAYTRVQAGAAFGGPIKKDKTYYYFAYEITRRHETGFSDIGQDNFGLVPFDASTLFGAPAGFFPDPGNATTGSISWRASGTTLAYPSCRRSFHGRRFFGHRRERKLSGLVRASSGRVCSRRPAAISLVLQSEFASRVANFPLLLHRVTCVLSRPYSPR